MSTRSSKRRHGETEANHECEAAVDLATQPAQAVVNHLNTRINLLQVQMQQVGHEKQVVVSERDALAKTQTELQSSVQALNRDNKRLVQHSTDLQREREHMNSRLAKSDAALLGRNHDNSEQLRDSRQQTAQLRDALAQAAGHIEDLRDENAHHRQTLLTLKQSLADVTVHRPTPTDAQLQAKMDEFYRDVSLFLKRFAKYTVKRGDFHSLSDEQTLWLRDRMPWFHEDAERKYKIKMIMCIVATTILIESEKLGPFRTSVEEGSSSLAEVAKAFSASHKPKDVKRWSDCTAQMLKDSQSPAINDAKTFKVQHIIKCIRENFKALQGLSLHDDDDAMLEQLILKASMVTDEMNLCRETLIFEPDELADPGCRDFAIRYDQKRHQDISNSNLDEGEDTRVSDIVVPGLFKTHDEDGKPIEGGPHCIWKTRILICRATVVADSDGAMRPMNPSVVAVNESAAGSHMHPVIINSPLDGVGQDMLSSRGSLELGDEWHVGR